jgi:hypothetical protein
MSYAGEDGSHPVSVEEIELVRRKAEETLAEVTRMLDRLKAEEEST